MEVIPKALVVFSLSNTGISSTGLAQRAGITGFGARRLQTSTDQGDGAYATRQVCGIFRQNSTLDDVE